MKGGTWVEDVPENGIAGHKSGPKREEVTG
jgi:hypothetical protein